MAVNRLYLAARLCINKSTNNNKLSEVMNSIREQPQLVVLSDSKVVILGF
jgi:hypothetical protein